MSPERETMLCNRYPDLLPAMERIRFQELSIWGFECGDGWFDLIDCLLATISVRHQINSDCEPVIIDEVKEKYGTLSIMYRGGDSFVQGAINLAITLSPRICEVCGDKAPYRTMTFRTPRCIAHEKL